MTKVFASRIVESSLVHRGITNIRASWSYYISANASNFTRAPILESIPVMVNDTDISGII